MIGTFLAFGLAAVAIGSRACAGLASESNREKALASGSVDYFDKNGKRHATETGEIVFDTTIEGFYGLHYVLMGANTRRIYKDYTNERRELYNKTLKQQGKRFEWREYPWHWNNISSKRRKAHQHPCYLPFDLDKQLPYTIVRNQYTRYKSGDAAKPFYKEYYSTESVFGRKVQCVEYMTEDEVKEWDYGGMRYF